MNLQEFLGWITRYEWLHIMYFDNNELRGYTESDNLDSAVAQQKQFRTKFEGRIKDDFTKSNGRYYFTIQF
jgi:hypothetical protein